VEDVINEYTEESLEEWEENGALTPWEAGFIRGAELSEEETFEE